MPERALDPAPLPPLPPEDGQCCGSGCEQCVWTVYFAAQAAYRLALADWQARQATGSEELNG